MELILISEEKLKVMLDENDMNDLSMKNTCGHKAREAIGVILREAKKRCGFDASGGRIYVQMYPGRKGGCELFVTKLALREEVSMLRAGADRVIAEYRKPETDRRFYSGHVIYAFREMGYLLSTCACLLSSGYMGGSGAWHDPAGMYYLSLDEETLYAGEHFGRLCPSAMYYYINEHCRLICSEAVPILGNLA